MNQSRRSVDNIETKGEKRERIKKNRSKMLVTGAGVKNLLRIKIARAAK